MLSVLGVSVTLFLTAAPREAAAPPPNAEVPRAAPATDPIGPIPPRRAFAVLPVGDPGALPSAEVTGAAQALRRTLRDHGATALGATELRARLGAAERDLSDLERAYAGAHAAFQADELESAARILESVIAELDQGPESAAGHGLRLRAQLRLAQVQRARGQTGEAAATMERILALDPRFVVDPDQFAPSFRRAFEEARGRMQLARRSTVTIGARGVPVTVFVEGKPVGRTPVTLELPAGRYRVRGAVGTPGDTAPLTPAALVTVSNEPVTIELDATLAGAVRVAPVLAVDAPAASRGATVTAVGGWVRADQVVAVEADSAGGAGITATLYDVQGGAYLREAHAPVRPGGLRAESADALARFLLTGERPSAPIHLDLAPSDARPPARWLRPAAWAAGALAVALGTVAVVEARAAQESSAAASTMVRPDGALAPGTDRAQYDEAVRGSQASMRGAWIVGAGAVVVAITAGVLGYRSLPTNGDAALVPAIRF